MRTGVFSFALCWGVAFGTAEARAAYTAGGRSVNRDDGELVSARTHGRRIESGKPVTGGVGGKAQPYRAFRRRAEQGRDSRVQRRGHLFLSIQHHPGNWKLPKKNSANGRAPKQPRLNQRRKLLV